MSGVVVRTVNAVCEAQDVTTWYFLKQIYKFYRHKPTSGEEFVQKIRQSRLDTRTNGQQSQYLTDQLGDLTYG